MRILLLTTKLPYPPICGRVKPYYILRALAEKHEIILVSFFNEAEKEYIPILRQWCKDIQAIPRKSNFKKNFLSFLKSTASETPFVIEQYNSKKMRQTVFSVTQKHRIDLVYFWTLHTAQYLPCIGTIPAILETVNIDHILWKRLASTITNPIKKKLICWQANKLLLYEQKMYPKFLFCVTESDTDRNILVDIAPSAEAVTFSDGVDLNYYQAYQSDSTQPNTLAYVGTMSWKPNQDAVLYFCKEIFPQILKKIPQAKFKIIGADPPKEIRDLASDHIEVTGYVEDVRPHIKSAEVYVAPIRIGSGIKYKILEAFAMGIPVVSTSIGVEGLKVIPGKHCLVADTPVEFADAIVNLLQNKQKQAQLVSASIELVKQEYSWDAMCANFLYYLEAKLHGKK